MSLLNVLETNSSVLKHFKIYYNTVKDMSEELH